MSRMDATTTEIMLNKASLLVEGPTREGSAEGRLPALDAAKLDLEGESAAAFLAFCM